MTADFGEATFNYKNPWVTLTQCAELFGVSRGELYGKVYASRLFSTRINEEKTDIMLYLPDVIAFIKANGLQKIGIQGDDLEMIGGLLRLQQAPG